MRFMLLTVFLAAGTVLLSTARADDAPAGGSTAQAGQTQTEKPATADGSADQSSAKKPAASKSDRDLLKDLVPELPLPDEPSGESADDANAPDELDRAVKAMRDAAGRLSSRDASSETRRLQTAAKDDLRKLIEKLRQPPPPSSSSSQSNQDQQSQDRNQARQQQRTSSSQQKQQVSGQGQSGTPMPQRSDSKAADSEEQNDRQAREHATAVARRRALINEIWGHLPPSMREKLMNVRGEKTLPQYEDLIRRYYEALAESTSAGPATPAAR